jgi:hypothetical protein
VSHAFIKPQKAKQTNRVKEGSGTRLLSSSEVIAWAATVDPKRYWAEIKHNGFRAQFRYEGWWTTKPTWVPPKGYAHICDFIPVGVVLDGELVPNDGEGHEVVAHYRSACPEKLKFVVFDILQNGRASTLGMSQTDRRELLVSVLSRPPLSYAGGNIEIAQVFQGDFASVLKDALANGREGLIFKDRTAKYTPGSRSAWLKCKATETVDVVITDCDSKPTEWRVKPGEIGKDGVFYPNGRHSDPWLAGHVGLSYGFYDALTGKLVRVGSLGVTGPRAEMEKHVGRVAEVASFGPQFPTGAIQHPTFLHWREDKNATDCVFDFGVGYAPEVVSSSDAPFDVLSVLLS